MRSLALFIALGLCTAPVAHAQDRGADSTQTPMPKFEAPPQNPVPPQPKISVEEPKLVPAQPKLIVPAEPKLVTPPQPKVVVPAQPKVVAPEKPKVAPVPPKQAIPVPLASPCFPLPGAAPSTFRHLNGCLLVFVADASESEFMSDNLKEIVREERVPVLVKQVKWSRLGELYRDAIDQEAQIDTGYRLACLIKAIRQDAPTARFILVGHGAGSRVMLAAAEYLPQGSVERIFLMASSVSCSYDLRHALAASRLGIDNYFSPYDNVLETLEDQLGTSDGKRAPTAGRVGFRPPFPPGHPGLALYCNLRQTRWSDERGGNGLGGHYTWAHRPFLRNQLLPQFFYPPLPPR